MDLSERVIAEIRAEMARQRCSGRSLAAQLGWPQPYLSRRLSGRTPIDLKDVEAIAAVLGVPVTALFDFPGRVRTAASLTSPWPLAVAA